jgi:hypothetical protein
MIQKRNTISQILYARILGFWIIVLLAACSSDVSIFNVQKVQVYPENKGTIMGFAFADINGDNYQDLIAHEGAGGGFIYWYKNNGNKSWKQNIIAQKGPNNEHFSVGDLEVGDIDNDGDIDVLAFEHPGEWSFDYTGKKLPTKIYWYENVDPENSIWIPHYVGESPDFIKDVELIHLDTNNLLDIVTITYIDDHNFSVFRQDTIDGWTLVQSISIDNLHEGMDSGDIDGDGDLDIATNGLWIENPGGNLEGSWAVHTIDEKWNNQTGDWRKNATKIYCRDITGDGRVEVFICHSEGTGYPLSWYQSKYQSDTWIWEEHTVVKGYTAVHTLQVDDIDKDGDYDILFGENGDHQVKKDDSKKQVRILMNQGDNLSWTMFHLSNEGLYNGLFVDVNNDGWLDIGGPSGHENDPYTIYINLGSNL